MKKYLFKVTAYAFALCAILLFAAGCNHHKQQIEKQLVVQDTLFESTGNEQLDSLLQLAASSPQDTNLVLLYNEIADMYENNDFEQAKTYYLKTGELSEQLNWNKGRYVYAAGFASILNREGLIDSALVILKPALEIAKREKDELWAHWLAINIGNTYNNRGWYETALSYYMEALPFFERRNDSDVLEEIYYSISQIYLWINATEKALEYGEKAVALKPEDPYALVALARVYKQIHQFEKSNNLLKEALRTCEQQNSRYITRHIYLNISNNALSLYDLETAEIYRRQAFEIGKEIGDNLTDDLMILSQLEKLKGHYVQSEAHILEALKLAAENNINEAKRNCYMLLSELSAAQHKYRENVEYENKLEEVEIAIARETTLRTSEEMAAKYETEKKELKISALEEERLLILWLGIAGGAVLLLALAAAVFLWRWTVKKKQLAEIQIKQFEQEKQLVATQAVLDGETRERARLARDLHDGLGSILTGVRLNLQEMKNGAKLDYADVECFNRALGLLDDSVREMRRVSHNLMPDSLSRFGLKPAVNDFCRSLSANIVFDYFGNEVRLDPRLEVVIYRSIHELVNNALKYSGASQILVQIMQEPDRIAFTVEDDGCGFDPAAVTGGTGIQNIRTRVASFGGNIYIDSKIGKGTEVNGELKIKN